MHHPKKKKKVQSKQEKPNWLDYIDNEKKIKRAAIPVGPKFQAVLPDLHDRTANVLPHQTDDRNSDASRFLGIAHWPTHDGRQNGDDDDKNIGKGRCTCRCRYPGSTECIKRHVTSEREGILSELGPVFDKWKFGTMGENVANSWTPLDEKKFEFIVRKNPVAEDHGFLKAARTSFPSKTVYHIVNYYLNVFIPRRISMKCRSGIKVVYSDEDEEYDAYKPQSSKDSSRKRPSSSAGGVKPSSTKSRKSHWLGGKR